MAQVLGRYHIISELGRGGMGVVYKALDPKLERFIAIKCLSDELSDDEIIVARFLREARNVAALNHPNIAQIFVADEHDGKPYFVMEYVDGESLADFIDREGQCSPEMARRVTEQAATALAAAADEGIVHRDVKPGNIMIDRRGRAVLTDFGIACAIAEQAQAGRQEMIMGTPGYLPPESLTGDPVDARGDMFALGAVYYEMLTGRRLMAARDLKESFAQLARPDFPDLSTLEGQVDERVLAILRRLLAVKPENRYGDYPALLAEMAPLKTGRTGPVKRPDSGPSTAEREVTEALATDRTDPPTVAVSEASEDTAAWLGEDPGTQANTNHPVPVPEQRPKRRVGALVALGLLVLVLVAAAAFGLTRVDSAGWQRVTAWLPGGDDTAEPAPSPEPAQSGSGEEEGAGQARASGEQQSMAGAGGATRAGQATLEDPSRQSGEDATDDAGLAGPGSGQDAGGESLASDDTVDADHSAESGDMDEAPAAPGERRAQDGGDGPTASGSGRSLVEVAEADEAVRAAEAAGAGRSPASDERSLAMADTETPSAASDSAAAARVEPASPPPRGVVVIGVGDPVVADPMVREIESALRDGDHPLVQRSFVSGYRDYIEGEEVDLNGLAGPALDAGARYVVVARALPAGERELQYYNRVETAYIAQLEAVTYDLHDMRQMGSSPVEQIEFTSLNATRRAVDSVKPWLPGIRSQFD